MKTMMKTAALCTSLLMALVACQPKEKVVEKNHIVAEQSMTADALTASAEQLISPYNFPIADRMLDMALANDPTNEKAQFLKVLLKRFTVFKGVLGRMLPIADANGNGKNLRESIAKLPNTPLKEYLMDNKGLKDIKDAYDVQSFLVEYRDALNELRTFVKKHPDLDIVVNLNPNVFQGRIEENQREACVLKQIDGGYDVKCDFLEIARVRMVYADLQVLAQEAAGEMLYFSLLTAYSVKGLDSLFKDLEPKTVCHDEDEYDGDGNVIGRRSWCSKQSPNIPQREIMSRVENVATAAKLRGDHSLGVVKEIGADLSSAVKYMMKYQASLCPKPDATAGEVQRRGYLVKKGFCVEDMAEADRQLTLFDALLNQIVYRDLETANGEFVAARVDAMALFEKPVVDLRSIMPATWNTKCDTAASLRDKTLGGLFVDSNAETFLIKRCE